MNLYASLIYFSIVLISTFTRPITTTIAKTPLKVHHASCKKGAIFDQSSRNLTQCRDFFTYNATPSFFDTVLLHQVAKKHSAYKRKDELRHIPFFDESGNQYTLQDFKGKIIILYFWATWCLECIEELISLNALQAELLSNDISNIIIIPISIDFKQLSAIYQLYQHKRIDKIGLFVDKNRKLMQNLHAQFLPNTFLIDAQGRIVKNIQTHLKWTEEEIYSTLIQLRD